MNSLRKNEVETQVEFTFKVMERASVTCYCCISLKKNSLLVKVLKLFGILAGLCGCVMLREKGYDTKGPGSTLDCDLPPF